MSRTSPNYASLDGAGIDSGVIATPRANGRVDVLSTPSVSSLRVPGYGPQKREDNSTFCTEAILGNWAPSELSKTFFSVDNIEALQVGIKNLVHKRSNGRFLIGRQSDQELKIIMKGIYLQNAKHSPTEPILKQVRDLNQLVLDFSVPQIIGNLQQHEQYKKDISTLPVPMERAAAMSKKGTKTLETKTFI